MLDAIAVGREPGVIGERREPDGRAEPRPLALRADRDGDLPVGGGEGLVRDDVRVGLIFAARQSRATRAA